MHGQKVWNNYKYYRRYRHRRLQYFHTHHKQWKKMKRFARKLGLSLPEARHYIDQKLREWYIEWGLLEDLGPRMYTSRRRTFIVPAESPQPLPDKGDQSLD